MRLKLTSTFTFTYLKITSTVTHYSLIYFIARGTPVQCDVTGLRHQHQYYQMYEFIRIYKDLKASKGFTKKKQCKSEQMLTLKINPNV